MVGAGERLSKLLWPRYKFGQNIIKYVFVKGVKLVREASVWEERIWPLKLDSFGLKQAVFFLGPAFTLAKISSNMWF